MSKLCKDVVGLIGERLSDIDFTRLSKANREWWEKSKGWLAARLVRHIAFGRLDEALRMLKINTRLLYVEATVYDEAGRQLVNTKPYPCALGAGDVMTAQKLARMFANEQERLRQHKAQLPNGWVDGPVDPKASLAFDSVIQAIQDAKPAAVDAVLLYKNDLTILANQTDLSRAIQNFRLAVAPGKVTTGKYVNHQLELKGYQVYEEMRSRWCQKKLDLFWVQVLAYLDRSETARGAMDKANGLWDIVMSTSGAVNVHVAPRQFAFRSNPEVVFFPLDSSKGVGYDHHPGEMAGERAGRFGRGKLLQQVLDAKRVAIDELGTPRAVPTMKKKLVSKMMKTATLTTERNHKKRHKAGSSSMQVCEKSKSKRMTIIPGMDLHLG